MTVKLKSHEHILIYKKTKVSATCLPDTQNGITYSQVIRKPVVFPYSVAELKLFPEGTLGRDLVEFLSTKELQLLHYYAKHDIKHILLGYDTTDDGEVCLQCFMLGNRHISFPVMATVMYGMVTMPEYWSLFRQAIKRGRNCSPIENWKWFEILGERTTDLKNKVR